MTFLGDFLSDYLLTIVTLVITLVLIYNYFIGKGLSLNLSKRYKKDIYETQSKIFLNATKYLISGNVDLAIKEFLNAVEVNSDTIDTYFALGELFRNNGEINKAISIHRSIITRDNINQTDRIRALNELAQDFFQGGIIDQAINTYEDILSIEKDNAKVITALCLIYEDLKEWDEALRYRGMLSRIGNDNQSKVISQILVEKARKEFEAENFAKSLELLIEALNFAPSTPAKILRLQLSLVTGEMEKAEIQLLEICHEYSEYLSSIWEEIPSFKSKETINKYLICLHLLQEFFLKIDNQEILNPSVMLIKIKLLRQNKKAIIDQELMRDLIFKHKNQALLIEYIKLLIELKKNDEVLQYIEELLNQMDTRFKYYCEHCGRMDNLIFWRCPKCKQWETVRFVWKL